LDGEHFDLNVQHNHFFPPKLYALSKRRLETEKLQKKINDAQQMEKVLKGDFMDALSKFKKIKEDVLPMRYMKRDQDGSNSFETEDEFRKREYSLRKKKVEDSFQSEDELPDKKDFLGNTKFGDSFHLEDKLLKREDSLGSTRVRDGDGRFIKDLPMRYMKREEILPMRYMKRENNLPMRYMKKEIGMGGKNHDINNMSQFDFQSQLRDSKNELRRHMISKRDKKPDGFGWLRI